MDRLPMLDVTFGRRMLCASLLLCAACGRAVELRAEGGAIDEPCPPEPDRAAGGGVAKNTDHAALMEDLRGLGYVDWDTEADASLSGVVHFDAKRSWPGSNLYASGDREVFLTDMHGARLHTWRLPEDRTRTVYAELLADDTLAVVCNYRLLTRLDLDSAILWELPISAHHDVAEQADGTLLVPYRKPESWNGRKVLFDGIAFVSPQGRVLSSWSSFERREELLAHHAPSRLDLPAGADEPVPKKAADYYHLNSVEILPDTPLGHADARFRAGNLLVCFRNVNRIAILDQDDRSLLWSWGEGELEGAHMPSMLADGRILVFDNGIRRKATRVIELDPRDGRIHWQYPAQPSPEFYSELRGSAQRLPNGNTLICEADRGHVIEVTRAGEIVWEFWNPEMPDGMRKRIYRFMRLPPERSESLLAAIARLAASGIQSPR